MWIGDDTLAGRSPSMLLLTVRLCTSCLTGALPAQVLTCHLLHEVTKGRRSYWHPYLSKLPKEYTTLAHFHC